MRLRRPPSVLFEVAAANLEAQVQARHEASLGLSVPVRHLESQRKSMEGVPASRMSRCELL